MTPRAPSLPPDERRAALVAAARPLIAEFGGQYTTKQVAEAAGVAEGTIFRVFANKQDLTDAVVDDLLDPAPSLVALAAIDRGLPLEQRVARTIEILHEALARISALFMVLARDGHGPNKPPEDEDSSRATRDRHEQRGKDLEAAIADVLAPDAPRLRCSPGDAASLIRSIAFGTAHPHFHGSDEASQPARIAELFVNGLVRHVTPVDDPTVGAPLALTQEHDTPKNPRNPEESC